jgi:guanine deaminase
VTGSGGQTGPAGPAGPTADHGQLTWLRQALELATRSVAEGGGPFGAVVVRDGQLVATGHNRVTLDQDPTAHAEVNAIRAAGRIMGNHSLAGAVLYASCEPCPMCAAAIHWARLDRVYYAAPQQAAAQAGFDDARLARELDLPGPARSTPCQALPIGTGEALAPFRAWIDRSDRLPY